MKKKKSVFPKLFTAIIFFAVILIIVSVFSSGNERAVYSPVGGVP